MSAEATGPTAPTPLSVGRDLTTWTRERREGVTPCVVTGPSVLPPQVMGRRIERRPSVASRTKWLALLAGAAVVTGGAFAATGLAWPPDASHLASVPTANTKSDGYAPASRLSPQLRQIVVAQG